MGRPPIGNRAMTAAERQRLRRERMRKAERDIAKCLGKRAPDRDPTPAADLIEAQKEIKRLRQELAAVHAALDKVFQPAKEAVSEARHQIDKLQKRLDALFAAGRKGGGQ